MRIGRWEAGWVAVLAVLPTLVGCNAGKGAAAVPKAPAAVVAPITIKHRLTGATVGLIYAPSLVGASFPYGNLEYGDLAGRDLSRSDLRGTNLASANLQRAALVRASLPETNLVAADLTGADLHGANLDRADLSGARLQGADLSGATLSGATLMGTRYDRRTRWSKGFDPRAHGAHLED